MNKFHIFPFTVSEGRESHLSNTCIPTAATVTAFVFMMVIQSETYAPICLSGHLPIDMPLYPPRRKALPLAFNLEHFLKVWIPFSPSSLHDGKHPTQILLQRTHGTDVKDSAKLQHTIPLIELL